MLSVEQLDLYYGAAQALRGVSIEARAGAVTCVLGRNGVGKTSLMRAITGLERAREGRIVWEGRDIAGLRPDARARAGVALVPQGREIFPLLSVRENLETGFAPLPRAERTIPGEVFELFPVLGRMLRRRGGDLSGGQQQQLAIARALVTRPRLLVLDEPTEGIQPSVIKDIGRAIAYLRERGAVVAEGARGYGESRDPAAAHRLRQPAWASSSGRAARRRGQPPGCQPSARARAAVIGLSAPAQARGGGGAAQPVSAAAAASRSWRSSTRSDRSSAGGAASGGAARSRATIAATSPP